MSQPTREQRVSDAFVALADTLVDDYDIIDLLDQLVAHSVTLLAADAAGIMLVDPRNELGPVAASSEDAQTMELLQIQAQEGPCLECFRTVARSACPTWHRWPAAGPGSPRRSPPAVSSCRCTPFRCGYAARPSAP